MKEESVIMRIKKISKITTSILFVMFIIAASVTGSSNAWFNAISDVTNTFTAGTVLIEAGEPAGDPEGMLEIRGLSSEGCSEVELTVTNTGTKYAYVRAIFDGKWRAAYHQNTATVTASYQNSSGVDVNISSSDSTHYIDGTYTGDGTEPSFGTISPSSWFTATDSTLPLLIEPSFPVYFENGVPVSSAASGDIVFTGEPLSGSLLKQVADIGLQSFSLTSTSTGPPIVDGLFYGDGDDQLYTLIGVGEYGSKVYYYMHETAPGDVDNNRYILYGVMVVDRNFNDNAFDGDRKNPTDNSTYMGSAGWSDAWGGKARSFFALTNSEYVTFNLKVDGNTYEWGQYYAAENNNLLPESQDWAKGAIFDSNVPLSLSLTSASSIIWNMNNSVWANEGYVIQSNGDWKSPYVDEFPDDVTKVDGYPYPVSEPITFNYLYQWEWPMVYEFSVDLTDVLGVSKTIEILTGLSHHSPSKIDGEDEENYTSLDWGDLPSSSYNTLMSQNGPRHNIVIGGAYLGTPPDPELDGPLNSDALGDDLNGTDDEDGIDFLTPFVSGSTAQIRVTAGTAGYLSAWIDFNGDGNLTPVELISSTGVVGDLPLSGPGVHILNIEVPDNIEVAVNIYSRWRYTNESGQGGNSLTGLAETGEIEDYLYINLEPGITIEKFVSLNDGISWELANEEPFPLLLEGNVPIFKFVITNTGLIPLYVSGVDDTVFEIDISDVDNLTPLVVGGSVDIFYPNEEGNWGGEDWKAYLNVETGDVSVTLCENPNGDWVLHDGYFYYTQPLASGASTSVLCVEICPLGVDPEFMGIEIIYLKAYTEAVQASNDAINDVWFGGSEPPIDFIPKP